MKTKLGWALVIAFLLVMLVGSIALAETLYDWSNLLNNEYFRIDRGPGASNSEMSVYGDYDYWHANEGTPMATKAVVTCPGGTSPRLYIWGSTAEDLNYRPYCAEMTPTPTH